MIETLRQSKTHWCIERFLRFPDQVALVHQDRTDTYRALGDCILDQQRQLALQGIRSGDVVAVVADYSLQSIGLFFALLANRNIIVPIIMREGGIDEKLNEAYVDKVISLSGGDLQVEDRQSPVPKHGLIERLQEKGHSGLVLFSSGTTGKPKAMIHDLDDLLRTYQAKKTRRSRILVFLIFDHIGGLNTLFNALFSGSTIIVPAHRDVDHVCALVERHRIDILPTSPTFLNLLLMSKAYQRYDLRTLRLITYGTEPMPPALLNRLQDIFPAVKLLQTFGTSETGIARTISKSSASTLLKFEDPNTEYKIVDGELWLKSTTRILGYLNAAMDRFTDDGWYKTGDLVQPAADGFLRIRGRKTDVINVGGEKVIPCEIEGVLQDMPQIKDCLVYGQDHAITGQIVVADVILSEGIPRDVIKKEVRKFCRNRMENYKIPVKVNVVDRLAVTDRVKKVRVKV